MTLNERLKYNITLYRYCLLVESVQLDTGSYPEGKLGANVKIEQFGIDISINHAYSVQSDYTYNGKIAVSAKEIATSSEFIPEVGQLGIFEIRKIGIYTP